MNNNKMFEGSAVIQVIDVETAYDPVIVDGAVIDNAICEIGRTFVYSKSRDLLGNPTDWEVGSTLDMMVKPKAAISPETSAIHNIIDADVRHAQTWDELIENESFRSSFLPGEAIAFCAHNIEMERSLLTHFVDVPWICTYKVAMRLWPDMPSHSNNSVRYHLNPNGLRRDTAHPVHRAGPDSYITAFILKEALNSGYYWQTLARWSAEPAMIPRCKIGEQYRNGGRGTPWAQVETSMLHWILGKDFGEDIKHTVRYHLEQREIDQRLAQQDYELQQQMRANGFTEEHNQEAMI